MKFPRVMIGLCSLLLVGGLSTVAFAAIPDPEGKISGCYAIRGGALRVIDLAKGQRCTSFERSLAWNQTGPQGPVGSQGPSGVSEGFDASENLASGPLTLAGIDMIRLGLPAGKYIVTAEVSLQNTDASDPSLVWCDIAGHAPTLTQVDAGSYGHLSKTTWLSLPQATNVSFTCGLGTDLQGETRRVASEITAVKVDQLTVQPGGPPG